MIKKGRGKKRLKEAVMFVLYKDGKFLLEERTNPKKSYYGYTKVPGGKVENSESHKAAVAREIKEELGVKAIEVVLLDSFENVTNLGVQYLVHAYLVQRFEGVVLNRESKNSKHVWLTFKEATERAKFVDSKYALYLAERLLTGKD